MLSKLSGILVLMTAALVTGAAAGQSSQATRTLAPAIRVEASDTFELDWLIVEAYAYSYATAMDPGALEQIKQETKDREQTWILVGGRIGWPTPPSGGAKCVTFGTQGDSSTFAAMVIELKNRP